MVARGRKWGNVFTFVGVIGVESMRSARVKRFVFDIACAILSGMVVGFVYYRLTYMHFGGSFFRTVLFPGVAVGCFVGLVGDSVYTRVRRRGGDPGGRGGVES